MVSSETCIDGSTIKIGMARCRHLIIHHDIWPSSMVPMHLQVLQVKPPASDLEHMASESRHHVCLDAWFVSSTVRMKALDSFALYVK